MMVDSEPPPPQQEVEPAPQAGQLWIHGHWAYQDNRWAWQQGYWEQQRQNYVWVDGRWEQQGQRWAWVEGHWEAGSGPGPGTQYAPITGSEGQTVQPAPPPPTVGNYAPPPPMDTGPAVDNGMSHHEHAHLHPHELGDHHHHPHAHPHPIAANHHHPY